MRDWTVHLKFLQPHFDFEKKTAIKALSLCFFVIVSMAVCYEWSQGKIATKILKQKRLESKQKGYLE